MDQPREPVSSRINGGKDYHTSYEIDFWGRPYKYHRFEGKNHTITGFTADVLIEVATLAFHVPDFVKNAKGQLSRRRLIDLATSQADDFQTELATKTKKASRLFKL